MNEELKEYIQKWFLKAEHDLITARTILEHEPMVLDIVCFHCQQAVEKYFKAFLIYKEKNIEKTHDLILLQKKCSEADKDFIDIHLKNLGEFAVDARYPDMFLMPDISEAKEYLQLAEEIKLLVQSKIKL